MGKRTVVVEHGGVEYFGEIGTIKSTSFGSQDHGILSAMLHVEWQGGGIGAGGYSLDGPRKDDDGRHLGRFGSAFGLDHLMRIMQTVGVDSWEQLPGRDVIVLFETKESWGSTASGIAGITNDEVLIFREHADAFKALGLDA